MNLTDEEQAFVRAARDMENPQVVESDGEALAIDTDELDEYTTVEKAEYVEYGEQLETIRDGVEAALIEHGALSDRTVEQLPFTALWRAAEDIGPSAKKSEFETLTQEPETGGVGVDGDGEALAGDRDEIASLLSRARHLSIAAPERAAELREKAESLAGVESYEDIDVEVL